MAAHRWRVGKTRRTFDFGPYREAIRLYLLGKKPFPDNCALMFCVNPPNDGPKRLQIPYEADRLEGRKYGFMMVGLEFFLILGRQMNYMYRRMCLATGEQRLVVVGNATDAAMNDQFNSHVQSGLVKGKLAKLLKPS